MLLPCAICVCDPVAWVQIRSMLTVTLPDGSSHLSNTAAATSGGARPRPRPWAIACHNHIQPDSQLPHSLGHTRGLPAAVTATGSMLRRLACSCAPGSSQTSRMGVPCQVRATPMLLLPGLSRAVAAVLLCPVTVVKTRMEYVADLGRYA